MVLVFLQDSGLSEWFKIGINTSWLWWWVT